MAKDTKAPEAPLSTLSLEDGAKLAKIPVKHVLAVNVYADRVHVITKDGQKVVVETK